MKMGKQLVQLIETSKKPKGISMKSKQCIVVGVIGVALGLAQAGSATVIVRTVGTNGQFSASATDLMNAGQPTLSSVTFTNGTLIWGSVDKINDGTMYNGGSYEGTSETMSPEYAGLLTVVFDTSVNTHGYDISSFVSLSGSGGGQNYGSVQSYYLAFHYVGDGWVTNADVHPVYPYSASSELRMNITGDGGGLLASGVDQMQVIFTKPDSELTMYREMDVFGLATVPEPTVAGLLLIGGGLCLFRRRSPSPSATSSGPSGYGGQGRRRKME